MTKLRDYYGNSVYGDGEAPPLTNQEPDKAVCPLCDELVESENELVRYYSIIFNMNVVSCLECKHNDDEHILETIKSN